MATNPIPQKWTVEAYLAHELETGIRHEYVDGEIFAMSGGTDKHSLIIANITGALWQKGRQSSCRVYSSDMRVKISDTKYLYPDLSVVCGESTFDDDRHTQLTNPTLVVEVTSPSSQSYDKGIKAEYYRTLSSLQAYLVIDQHQIQAQLFQRQSQGWLLRQFNLIQQAIPLNFLNYDLPLHDVYFDISFDVDDK